MRILVAAVLALFAIIPVSSYTDWGKISIEVAKSVIHLETTNGSCTGFSIDEARDYVLTAAHCQGVGLTADGVLAEEVWKDKKKDLMVLRVKGMDKPALKFAKDNPTVGQEVMSIGYGYDLEHPLHRTAHISSEEVYLVDNGDAIGPFLTTDIAFAPGQSGGPVVDLTGRVVMIVQRASNIVGVGVGVELMRDKVGKYLEKEPVK